MAWERGTLLGAGYHNISNSLNVFRNGENGKRLVHKLRLLLKPILDLCRAMWWYCHIIYCSCRILLVHIDVVLLVQKCQNVRCFVKLNTGMEDPILCNAKGDITPRLQWDFDCSLVATDISAFLILRSLTQPNYCRWSLVEFHQDCIAQHGSKQYIIPATSQNIENNTCT